MVMSASDMAGKDVMDRELGVRLCGRLKVPRSLKLSASTPFNHSMYYIVVALFSFFFLGGKGGYKTTQRLGGGREEERVVCVCVRACMRESQIKRR